MKTTYIIFYFLSGIFFLTGIFGSTLFKPMFEDFSQSTLELAGFKRSYLQSIDSKIDELVYKSRQVELQIEKLKNFFTSEKIDESKYQKSKSEILEATFYKPIVSALNYIFMLGFILMSIIFLLFALVFHTGYRSRDLRKRVKKLEQLVYSRSH